MRWHRRLRQGGPGGAHGILVEGLTLDELAEWAIVADKVLVFLT
jgi:hypothetical protein